MPSERDKAREKPQRFSLKDAILVTLVVGLSVGWWLERTGRYESAARLRVEQSTAARLVSEQLLITKDEARHLRVVLDATQERLAREHELNLTYGSAGVQIRPLDLLPVEPPVVRYISGPTAADYGFYYLEKRERLDRAEGF